MNKLTSSAALFALAVSSWPALSQLGNLPAVPSVGGIADGALVPGAPINGTLDANAKININTATQASLQKELGLSEAQAAALIRHREEKGPIASAAELRKVEGLGAQATAKLERRATFASEFTAQSSVSDSGATVDGSGSTAAGSATASGKLNLNTASQASLQSELGLTRAEAAAVIRHREEKGAINSAAQLDSVNGLGVQGATKIRNGVAFGSQAVGDALGTAGGLVGGVVSGVAGSARDTANAASGTVDINGASRSALQSGLGITKKQAKALIAYRQKNGPFTSAAQIDSVSGIDAATAGKIKAGSRFDASASANTQSAR